MTTTGPLQALQSSGSLEHYAKLFRSLLPSTLSVHLFDAEGALFWSTEAMTGPDLPAAVQQVQLEARNRTRAPGRRLPLDGDAPPAYVWWLRSEREALLASVAVTTRAEISTRADADGTRASFEGVNAILRPAMRCLGAHLCTLARESLLQHAPTLQPAQPQPRAATPQGAGAASALAAEPVLSAALEPTRDPATGLLTLPALEHALRAALARSEAPTDWSLLYVDADRVHAWNERLGLEAVDAVLARVGELLRLRMPPRALGARVLGDRFVLALPLGQFQASEIAEQLRRSVAQLEVSTVASEDAAFTVTIGVAQVTGSGESGFAHALARAQGACRTAKQRGGNRVELHEDEALQALRSFASATLGADSRETLARQARRLEVLPMQPLGATRSGGVPHYEVLLRMVGADGELLAPNRFMTAVERFDLMPAIDRWVFEQLVTMLRARGVRLRAASAVFNVNLSGAALSDASFGDFLVDAVQRSGIEPQALCFEIRESDAVAHAARTESLVQKLRNLGCGVALDDVGPSLACLSHLRTLPVTMLKFDGAFVRELPRDPRLESMLQAINQIAHTLSIRTVAEHVESASLREQLEALGVDFAQGFSIARPVPLEQVLDELATKEPAGDMLEACALAAPAG